MLPLLPLTDPGAGDAGGTGDAAADFEVEAPSAAGDTVDNGDGRGLSDGGEGGEGGERLEESGPPETDANGELVGEELRTVAPSWLKRPVGAGEGGC